jgi:type I restriction enzyme, S subunit
VIELLEKHFDIAFNAPNGIEKLRELILTLAMQGKLVSQSLKDGHVDKLLKKIATEKQKWVREKKTKESKPFPDIKQEDRLYPLPESWRWIRLSDISMKIHYGYTASANHDLKDIRLLRITDIQDNRVEWASVPGCNIKEKDIDQYLLNNDDLLIARTGGTVGKSYLVENINVSAVFASYLIRVIPSKYINVNYLKFFIESPLYWKQLYEKCSGTGQPNVNGTALSTLLLTLPPINEQRRIVARIDQLMARCDELEKLRVERDRKRITVHMAACDRLLTAPDSDTFTKSWQFITQHFNELYTVKKNVTELHKAILQLAVMGKFVSQDDNYTHTSYLAEEIRNQVYALVIQKPAKKIEFDSITISDQDFSLPETWAWARLGSLLQSIKYGTSKKCTYSFSGTAVLRIPNIDVENGCIDANDLKRTKLSESELQGLRLTANDLLMIRSNGSKSLVGRVAVVSKAEEEYAYAGYLVRLRLLSECVCSRYLCFALNTVFVRQQIERPIRTTSGVKNINSKEISNLLIPLPPLAEQYHLVNKIDQLINLCNQLEKKISAAAMKQTDLLHTVMSKI